MSWNGKIIGLIVGVLFAGPFGMFLGFTIGHLYDIGVLQRWFARLTGGQMPGGSHQRVQQVFFDASFTVMGYLAKSDGRVSEKEINAARRVMDRMGLSMTQKHEAIDLFNRGKQAHFNLANTMQRLKQACWTQPSLLRTFLEIQMQIAYADGSLSSGKRAALHAICAGLGVSSMVFEQFERQSRAESNYQRYSQQRTWGNPQQQLNDAYAIIGVAATAGDAEIKKAYRRQMSKHHPDKLMAKGLPPEMIKLANEKTQKIKSAYDLIKKQRGF